MRDAARPLPPFKTIERALRTTTEFLASEPACPRQLSPRWSEFEWDVARAVAALHGISALLATRLQWAGPERWQRFLVEQKTQTLLRQQRITELLAQIDAQARHAGVGAVALKGSALLNLGVYEPGTRPMGDVDLLIDRRDVDACRRLLAAIGYRQTANKRRHLVFSPVASGEAGTLGEHIDNPITIEVHTRIAELLPAFETDITADILPQRMHAGLNTYPSTVALTLHLLLHAAGNTRARALRFIQLHDIALLAARMTGHDWQRLLDTSNAKRGVWWAWPPLVLTSRYYPAAVPASVLQALEPRCPWLLRRLARRHELADVSWSKVRIQAFPGMEWSTSPREALLFAKSRVLPSRQSLVELQDCLVQRPALARVPWYGLPHGRRILRWVFSHPPRVQTILSVRSALGHDA